MACTDDGSHGEQLDLEDGVFRDVDSDSAAAFALTVLGSASFRGE